MLAHRWPAGVLSDRLAVPHWSVRVCCPRHVFPWGLATEDRIPFKEVIMQVAWSIVRVLLVDGIPVAAEQDGYRSTAGGLEQQDQPV